MKSYNNCFIRHLDILKVSSGKSYNQIERELGYPRNALNNYKHGTKPSATRLMELANYFNVEPGYLIGDDSDVFLNTEVSKTVEVIFKKLNANEIKEMSIICQKWLLSQV